MAISRRATRSALFALFAVTSLWLAPGAGASGTAAVGDKAPQIRNTSMRNAEEGGIALEVGAVRAKRVVVTVGEGSTRERVELEKGGHQNKLVFWEGTLSDRKEQCARVIMTAINSHARTARAEKVCIFGESKPEPPSSTLPI
mgnify:CR=1 FL=1